MGFIGRHSLGAHVFQRERSTCLPLRATKRGLCPSGCACRAGHSHGHCLSPGAAAAGVEGVALSPRWGPHTRLDAPRCSAALLVPHDISLERRAPRPAWMAAQGLSPSPRSGLTQPTLGPGTWYQGLGQFHRSWCQSLGLRASVSETFSPLSSFLWPLSFSGP